ncbi:MAG: response regulator [Lachnospiraceae bacterium]|nr:response regulator [Lachnospiraceae bacterium]
MYTVLVADDEQLERDLIRFLLTRDFPEKFHILEASHGEEALNIIQQEKVDILLTDVQMPFRSGIELAQEARLLNPDMEILFFSGFDDFEYVRTALLLRAVNYILKPVNPEEFQQIISDILSQLDSRIITFNKSSSYYNDSFYDHSYPSENAAEANLQSDKTLLEDIALSISLKRPEQLSELVNELIAKCSDSSSHSPVYIRHTAISLLQLLITATPSLTVTDFEAVAEKVYTLRHFSDIKKTILHYLELLTDSLHQEVDSANYSVFLVKQYIAEHYGEDITLNLLAEQVYLSPNYLSNMFTKVTGCSLHIYLKQFRMKKAQELLDNSNMKIVDICKAVGYPTPSYFIKTFQKMYGVTPSAYRANAVSRQNTAAHSGYDPEDGTPEMK